VARRGVGMEETDKEKNKMSDKQNIVKETAKALGMTERILYV